MSLFVRIDVKSSIRETNKDTMNNWMDWRENWGGQNQEKKTQKKQQNKKDATHKKGRAGQNPYHLPLKHKKQTFY